MSTKLSRQRVSLRLICDRRRLTSGALDPMELRTVDSANGMMSRLISCLRLRNHSYDSGDFPPHGPPGLASAIAGRPATSSQIWGFQRFSARMRETLTGNAADDVANAASLSRTEGRS